MTGIIQEIKTSLDAESRIPDVLRKVTPNRPFLARGSRNPGTAGRCDRTAVPGGILLIETAESGLILWGGSGLLEKVSNKSSARFDF